MSLTKSLIKTNLYYKYNNNDIKKMTQVILLKRKNIRKERPYWCDAVKLYQTGLFSEGFIPEENKTG